MTEEEEEEEEEDEMRSLYKAEPTAHPYLNKGGGDIKVITHS